jgi:Uma2 family endonuclease
MNAAAAKSLPARHPLTVMDFHKMGEAGIFPPGARVELINGEIIDMAPIGSPHAGKVKRLNNLLTRILGDQAIIDLQNPVILGDLSEPQPDIAVLRPRADFYEQAHPRADDVLLLIEVADTTARYDREIKMPLYARHGIVEVWLLDLEHGQLEIYREPNAEGSRQVVAAEHQARIALTALPEVSIAVADIL